MAPTDPCCSIGTKINTTDVHVNSLAECLRRSRANKKPIILIGTALEMEIVLKATALDRRRTFAVARFNLNGSDIKVATINTRSVKLHTLEPTRPSTGIGGGERAANATKTTTGDTTVTDPVYVQVFKEPAPDPLNDEALIVVVAHPMVKTPGQPLSPLT